MDLILSGDIGGTHTRLALYKPKDLFNAVCSNIYPSNDYNSLEWILDLFLDQAKVEAPGYRIMAAGLGVAGPVKQNQAKITNLPWRVNGAQLSAKLKGAPVRLLNDFEAVALSVEALGPQHTRLLGGGDNVNESPRLVIGAGTGLGVAFLLPTPQGWQVMASEGGHADFAPRTPAEMRLATWLSRHYGRATWERVVSGPGLVNIHRFLLEEGGQPPNAELEALCKKGDPAAVISTWAMSGRCEICSLALEMFCQAFGSVAGNLAVTSLAAGGVYLAGGIGMKVLSGPWVEAFNQGFTNKGRFTEFLQGVAIHLITYPQPGLLGAALAAPHSGPLDA